MNKHSTPYASAFHGRITDGLDVATSLAFASDFLREQTILPSAQVPVAIASGRILAESVDLPFIGISDAGHRDCENAGLRAMLAHVAPNALCFPTDDALTPGDAASLSEGTVLTPQKIGLLAAMGMPGVWVRRKLPVAVMSLGENLMDPGSKKKRGHGFDAVRPMLMSALATPWIGANDLGIIGGDDRMLRLVLEQATTKNRVILASGIKDENAAAALKDVVLDLDGTILVNSVTIAPGQSAFIATLGGSLILTMPDNPVSAWNVFTVLGNEIICAAAHLKASHNSLHMPGLQASAGSAAKNLSIPL